jgi:deazaflavin-dependent oxidoreductase (nitroreductase family)
MAKIYELTPTRRLANWLMKALLRAGVGPKASYLLTVRGRKSGKMRTTPVTLVEREGQRWLVAPYGEVNWVRNARVAGEVTLTRGRRSETVPVVELSPEESAPILKEYVKRVPVTEPYFDAAPDAPVEAFVAEAERHPVFRGASA